MKAARTMKKTVMLGAVTTWNVLNEKEALAALGLSAHQQTTMLQVKMMNGMTHLISRLHTIINAVDATQRSSYILHPSIGAVFFDVTPLLDLMFTLWLVKFEAANFPFSSWAPNGIWLCKVGICQQTITGLLCSSCNCGCVV